MGQSSGKSVIAIIGSGAVGCYYGGRLAQHGLPVHFLFRSGFKSVKSRGLVVKSIDGDFKIPTTQLNIYDKISAMPKVDLVIVALKTTANDLYEPLIGPLLHKQSVILTLQNGLGNEERLAELFGADRILGGLVFACINRLPDGSIDHTDYGNINLAEFYGVEQERTREIAGLFVESGIKCKVVADLRRARWEKLIWNIPFNGLGAALNKTTDKLIATDDGRDLVKHLMLEVISVAKALGISFPEDIADKKIQGTYSMGAYKTSMQIDRQEGRPLESKALLRQPLEVARSLGVAVPYLEMLCSMSGLP